MGDIVAIVDSNGAAVVEYEYDPWGVCTIVSDTSNNNLGELNPFRYRGYYYDEETDLYYLQSRYYDPVTCKFINADDPSILFADPFNVQSIYLWDYCGFNPVNNIDKNGNIAVSTVVKTVINAVSGYYIGKAIANYFKLTGWKRKLCIGATSGLMVVIGWFSPVSIFNAIKAAIAATASAFLSSRGYTVSRDLFNHAIYGYGKAPSNKIKNALISKLKKLTFIKNTAKNQISEANKNKKNSFVFGWKSYEFSSGDLYYSLQHIKYKIIGQKIKGKWKVSVTFKDTYDFTEFSRVVKYGMSLGNAANDLGAIMQKAKMLYPFSIVVRYTL